jgi:formimidoylglutamate deiminase
LWAPWAFVDGRVREGVLLEISDAATWSRVRPDTPREPGQRVLDGLALPGLVNAHSHAFQRAFAGLAERRDAAHDDFWTWRERMYQVALRIGSQELQAVATQLYIELLRGGYTHVCEFHYLQHAADGTRFADELAMTHALVRAAARAGIGLTLLPVLYERAGFAQPAPREEQRRFVTSVDDVLRYRDAVRALGRARVLAGVAIHSLRAARAQSIAELARRCGDDAGPIHVHVAEQVAEVEECIAATGARPIHWLCEQVGLDARWQLVHATHATPEEIEAVARSGAGIVLCPTTEANLGDGLCDLPGWLSKGVPIAIGSDSQITRDFREELRWLEYGQRLRLRQRNVSAAPAIGFASGAQRLLQTALSAGGHAAGFTRWGFEVGAPADLLVVDSGATALLGLSGDQLFDALVFSSPSEPFRDVLVGGLWVVQDHKHVEAATAAADFETAMGTLHPPAANR